MNFLVLENGIQEEEFEIYGDAYHWAVHNLNHWTIVQVVDAWDARRTPEGQA